MNSSQMPAVMAINAIVVVDCVIAGRTHHQSQSNCADGNPYKLLKGGSNDSDRD
jgi:hypothetical protein